VKDGLVAAVYGQNTLFVGCQTTNNDHCQYAVACVASTGWGIKSDASGVVPGDRGGRQLPSFLILGCWEIVGKSSSCQKKFRSKMQNFALKPHFRQIYRGN